MALVEFLLATDSKMISCLCRQDVIFNTTIIGNTHTIIAANQNNVPFIRSILYMHINRKNSGHITIVWKNTIFL